jgi:hypothetical protein
VCKDERTNDMVSRVIIPARFNGPPASGNGGYASGALGTLIGNSAQVTLRSPPPLDRELAVSVDGEGAERAWKMTDGETLVASGRSAEPDLVCPAPVAEEYAKAAESSYAGDQTHPYPTCFVCGPARAEGDGLRLFTGKVQGRNVVASTWTPAESMGSRDGNVDPIIVWSALDCPTYFGGRLNDYGRLAVLGRMTATLLSPLKVGEPLVVVGWPLGRDGRKWEGGSAIFSAEGELRAFARGLWVELKQ